MLVPRPTGPTDPLFQKTRLIWGFSESFDAFEHRADTKFRERGSNPDWVLVNSTTVGQIKVAATALGVPVDPALRVIAPVVLDQRLQDREFIFMFRSNTVIASDGPHSAEPWITAAAAAANRPNLSPPKSKSIKDTRIEEVYEQVRVLVRIRKIEDDPMIIWALKETVERLKGEAEERKALDPSHHAHAVAAGNTKEFNTEKSRSLFERNQIAMRMEERYATAIKKALEDTTYMGGLQYHR